MNSSDPQGNLIVSHVSIKGIVSCVPPEIKENHQFGEFFSNSEVDAVCKFTGVRERRIASENVSTGDLGLRASQTLLKTLDWRPDSIDALIFLSQTPDFLFPPTALRLHGHLGCKNECVAFDVNLGCSGYPYALFIGAKLLDGMNIKRALVVVGDTISKVVDEADRATALLFGDAATATALEYCSEGLESCEFELGSDGSGYSNLAVPGSGFNRGLADILETRQKCYRPGKLFMDGTAVMEFTLSRVSEVLKKYLSREESTKTDYFLLHQANRFIIQTLIKKLKVDENKFLFNIERFGNTSSASIPLLMTTNLQQFRSSPLNLCLLGFGVGYSWAMATITLNPACHLEMIEYDI